MTVGITFEREESDPSGLIRGRKIAFKANRDEYVVDKGDHLPEGGEYAVTMSLQSWTKWPKNAPPVRVYNSPG